MPKKQKNRIAAVIDIGSNELKLLIAQADGTDSADGLSQDMRYLETLNYPLGLGRDTFQTGKMSFDKVDKACEIIKNFLTVTQAYGVRDIRAVATTAVREATNRDYILDQIKIKTGLSVNVIDDMEEKLYIYKLLMRCVGAERLNSAMMVYIGAGNVGLSVLSDGRMPYLRNIKVGSLRMGELFGDLEEYTRDFYRLMEEYLASFTDVLADEIPSGIRHFVVSGHEIGMMSELTGVSAYEETAEAAGIRADTSADISANTAVDILADSRLFEIPCSRFLSLYNEVKGKTADRIAVEYGIDIEKADVLLPAACIYQNLLRFTSADRITASRLLPCDAVLYEMLYPKAFAAFNKQFAKNTLLSAKMLAGRYCANESHYKLVYEFAMTIFDKMKKIHGLGSRDKLLLQTAAILHDTGKYINHRNHYRHSYEIIRGSDIVGLSHLETEIVALICLYHSRHTPSFREPPYSELDRNHRVRVSKLTAILRVADALDRSHTRKYAAIAVSITDEAMIVTVPADTNIALEQWSFNDKGRFFEEVFGIKAVFRAKINRLTGLQKQ